MTSKNMEINSETNFKKDIESKKGKKAKGGGGKIGLKVPFIDKITNFLLTFLWGAVVMKLVDFIDSPGVMKFLDIAKNAAKVVGNVGPRLIKNEYHEIKNNFF